MILRVFLPSIIAITMQTTTIFKFSESSDISDWSIVDDVVMGGRSSGNFYLNKEGNGVFEGRISLDNNGGFSSVRYNLDKMSTKSFSKVIIRLKGDGKSYQFRIKNKLEDYYSYLASFETSNDWETIEVSLAGMYPAFRGRNLDMPNFDKESIEEIAFLIGNKKEEIFKLEIESIVLK